MSGAPRNLFADLGISIQAGSDEVHAAYRRMAQQHHPDKNPGDPSAARERFLIIREAFEILRIDEARALHREAQLAHWKNDRNGLGGMFTDEQGWVMPGARGPRGQAMTTGDRNGKN